MRLPVHTVSAGGLVLRGDEVLLQRSARRGWEFPGGMVEEGESVVDGLLREIREETGVVARPVAFVGAYSSLTPRPGYGPLEGTMLPPALSLLFLCEYVSGEARVTEETLEVEWVTREEARRRVSYPSFVRRMNDMLAFDGVAHFRSVQKDAQGSVRWLEDYRL